METTLENETQIKEIFKVAVMEALEERKDLFGKLFREISEDIAIAKAIEEGDKTPKVSREEIFKLLERNLES